MSPLTPISNTDRLIQSKFLMWYMFNENQIGFELTLGTRNSNEGKLCFRYCLVIVRGSQLYISHMKKIERKHEVRTNSTEINIFPEEVTIFIHMVANR